MSDVEIKLWENKELKIRLLVIRYKTEFWFIGREIGKVFGYANTVSAIRAHVFSDYKITFGEFFDKLSPESQSVFNPVRSALGHFFPKRNQILIKEPAIYCMALNSQLDTVEPFQRWVYKTITTIREKGFYYLPEIEDLSLEDRKKTTEYVGDHDIPDFIFIHPCGNIERKEYRDLLKEGYDKSKDLIRVNLGSIGGKKSGRNTKRTRDLVRDLSREDKKSLSRLSRAQLYDYISNLIDVCVDIVKDFKT